MPLNSLLLLVLPVGTLPVLKDVEIDVYSYQYVFLKNHICFQNTPRRIPTGCIPESLLCLALRSQWNVPVHIVWPRGLDLWPMTLTYQIDLDILPLDLHAKIQVCMFVRSAVIARQTHTHTYRETDTHTHDVKTITPITSETKNFRPPLPESLPMGLNMAHFETRTPNIYNISIYLYDQF